MDIVLLAASNAGRKSRAVIDLAGEWLDEYEEGIYTVIYDLEETDMPFVDGKNYLDYGGEFTELLKSIMKADTLLIATPTAWFVLE